MSAGSEYGQSLLTTTPVGAPVTQRAQFSDGVTGVGLREPGPGAGDWNVDTPPVWTYVILWTTTAQAQLNNRALWKLIKNRKWSECQCFQFCVSHALAGVKLSIEGGSSAEARALESRISEAVQRALASAPKLRSGEAGACGKVEGGECGERCGLEFVEDVYRIPISGQVRLSRGGVASFLGFLLIRGSLIAILYRGLPPFPGEPRDPEIPPYRFMTPQSGHRFTPLAPPGASMDFESHLQSDDGSGTPSRMLLRPYSNFTELGGGGRQPCLCDPSEGSCKC